MTDASAALISAGAALAGATLSQVVTLINGAIQHKREKRAYIRSKYEAVTDHLSSTLAWMDKVVLAKNQEELEAHGLPIDARRIYALSLLYFQELESEAQALIEAAQAFHSGIEGLIQAKVLARAVDAEVATKKMHVAQDAASKAAASFRQARMKLDEKIASLASKYT